MTQQFNLPPGMSEVAQNAYWNAQQLGVAPMTAALQAALEWAVKEGWARKITGFISAVDNWYAVEDLLASAHPNEFPAIILRLEEPKP